MEVTIIRSNRKRMAIQVDSDLRVIVRVPQYACGRRLSKLLKRGRHGYITILKIEKKKAKYEEVNVKK